MRMRLVFGAALAAALASGAFPSAAAPPPPTFTQIAVGSADACAITSAGRLMCWGHNRFGQLGTGSRNNRWVPVDVAGRVPAPAARPASGYFQTPSRNIQCDYVSRTYVRCGIRSGLRPPPPRRGPGCSVGRWVRLGVTGRVSVERSVCPGEPEGDSGPFTPPGVARVLGYGQAWSGGGLSCTSAFNGLTCRNRSGHGFFLSRARWRAI